MNNQLKTDVVHPVYFVYGAEVYSIESFIAALKKRVVKGDSSFNFLAFNEVCDIGALYEAVNSLPLMCDKKCVLVKNLDIDGLNKDDFALLLKIIEDYNPATVLGIYTTMDLYNLKKSARIKKIIAAVDKVGASIEYATKSSTELVKMLEARALKFNITLPRELATYMVNVCGTSQTTLLTELQKILDYLQKGTITKAEIDMLVTKTINATTFDMCKSIVKGDIKLALSQLDDMFEARVEPIAIVGGMIMVFNDLYRAKLGVISNKVSSDIMSDFKYPANRAFAVKKAISDTSMLSIEQIQRGISGLYDADYTLKSSTADPKVVLEKVIISCRG